MGGALLREKPEAQFEVLRDLSWAGIIRKSQLEHPRASGEYRPLSVTVPIKTRAPGLIPVT